MMRDVPQNLKVQVRVDRNEHEQLERRQIFELGRALRARYIEIVIYTE